MSEKITPRETYSIVRATRTTQKSNGSKSWSSLPTQSARSNTESQMVGFSLPNYYSRKKRGELLPHTDFFQYWAQTDENSYSNTWESSGAINDIVKGSGSNTIQTEYEITQLGASYGGNIAKSTDAGMYLADAASAITSKGFDALTFLAQLHKVREMFRNVVQRVIGLLRNPRDIDHLASLWLEGRYGWRTLRFDLMDLEDAIRDFDVKRRRYTETRGTSYTTSSRTVDAGSTSAGTYDTITDVTIDISLKACITADISPSRFRTSLPTTAWELVPFSFVIDWFYDVGSALEAAMFQVSVSNYSASAGTKVSVRLEQTVGNLVKGNGILSWSFSRKQVETGEWVFRKPSRVSINPATRIKLDEWKYLDLLALLRQLYVKLRRKGAFDRGNYINPRYTE